MLSGRSMRKIRSIVSGVSGSKYTASAMAWSVMMVAGLELHSTTCTPASFSTRQAWVPA